MFTLIRSLLIAMLMLFASTLYALEASEIVVVYNAKVEGSKDVAEHYMKMRDIPKDNLIELKTSEAEEITRDEFDTNIRAPIKKWIDAHEDILAIVPVFGVPLKVKDTGGNKEKKEAAPEAFRTDRAGVDSELILLRTDEEVEIVSVYENQKLDSEDKPAKGDPYLIVCRIDGPTKDIALGLVDKAIMAETLGMSGTSLLDTRGITKDDGYGQRDKMMRNVAPAWEKIGLKFDHDDKGPVVDLSTRENLLHYYGWYETTHKPKGEVKFRTGAIAVHLHSFAANTLRNTSKNWVAPLLNWGCTATYGTVYEPYTVGFPYENMFWDRLAQGWSFGEAALVSNHLISWMSVFVGDPLYTPYRENGDALRHIERELILAELGAGGSKANADGEPYQITVEQQHRIGVVSAMLKAFEDEISKASETDPTQAWVRFKQVRELVDEEAFAAWLTKLSAPFEEIFEKRFEIMKDVVKDDENRTAELEIALKEWQGLAVHDEVIALVEDLKESHEKDCAKLLAKAEKSYERKKYFDAWQEASEAASYHFAQDSLESARKLIDKMIADVEIKSEILTKGADEIDDMIKKAERYAKRDQHQKVLDELWTVERYLDCASKTKALEMIATAQAALAAGEE